MLITPKLYGHFSRDSLIGVIQTMLKLPQEGRLNIKNASDGHWGNVYHRRQQILEVNCRSLRSDAALEQMISWENGDYLYYALSIPKELEKTPISARLFQTLFGTRSAAGVARGTPDDFRKSLRTRLLASLGPIADYLIAEALESSGLQLEDTTDQQLAVFNRALLSVTPVAYHDRVETVLRDIGTNGQTVDAKIIST